MTTTTAPGAVRTARTEQTRAAIVAAAHDAFVTRGYRATSLRDIAAAAGISHPGLLRHFATKDQLLAAVVDLFERDNETELLERMAAEDPGHLAYSELARHNETVPGYLALFAALTGEASTPRHPAHEIMRDRYARLRELSADAIDEAITQDTVAADRDPGGEAVRIAAAWDGLQLLAQYLPERVDIAQTLETYEESLALPVGWRGADDPPPATTAAPVPPMPSFATADAAPSGYRVGRERRALIVDGATALFAEEGYGDTSLRDIAERVGVSKSTLLHHFASKEDLLSAVLSHRDRQIESRADYVPADRTVEELRGLPRGATVNAATAPGLIEVYAVLSCEAVPADHPAHAYFAERFRGVVDHFAALFRAAQEDGDLPSHRDPEFEALWLTALWDGLQYQWLYDRSSVDVAAQLSAHLDDVLPR
ncbi:TetR/AcrR family transcriptional regulator [Microbacterium trichothecenolyticum]|uniref:HTH-type transcriptional repressor KstR2 n=1 Tax=Microbacterium trichothecenolyticum TaxID=69370 RepID=A0A0M2HBJ7_MICTR|nr:TetR/AcrR family transcriptional regulator [Microbacterium trichothecenolyticum]KJL43869.1 HTH-type transcriptional repressor KstR2 [Microbacterium trichothecenolyticum]